MSAACCVIQALQLSFLGSFPLTVGVIALLGAVPVLMRIRKGRVSGVHDDDASSSAAGKWSGREAYLAIFAGLVALIWLIGFIPAIAIFFPAFLMIAGKAKPVPTILMTLGATGFISAITWAMTLHLPEGLVGSMLF